MTIPNVTNGIETWPGGFQTTESAIAHMDSHLKQKLFYTLAHILHKQVDNCILYSALQVTKAPPEPSVSTNSAGEWFTEVNFLGLNCWNQIRQNTPNLISFFVNYLYQVCPLQKFFFE